MVRFVPHTQITLLITVLQLSNCLINKPAGQHPLTWRFVEKKTAGCCHCGRKLIVAAKVLTSDVLDVASLRVERLATSYVNHNYRFGNKHFPSPVLHSTPFEAIDFLCRTGGAQWQKT